MLTSINQLNSRNILRSHKKLKGETGYKLKLDAVVEYGLDIKHDVSRETNRSTESNVIMKTAQKPRNKDPIEERQLQGGIKEKVMTLFTMHSLRQANDGAG